MTHEEHLQYWLDSSAVDLAAMQSLFENGHFSWALFLAHLVIEKTLKAFYVKQIGNDVPMLHDLARIAEKSSLELNESQLKLLVEINTFNIKARYPDVKFRSYRKASREYTQEKIESVMEFRQWLLMKIAE